MDLARLKYLEVRLSRIKGKKIVKAEAGATFQGHKEDRDDSEAIFLTCEDGTRLRISTHATRNRLTRLRIMREDCNGRWW